MATRSGLGTFLNTCHRLCIFFGKYKPSIVAAVNASSLTSENKAIILASIVAIETACDAVDLIRVVWES